MKKKIVLKNLGCANCAAKMEEKIAKVDGVRDVVINFMTTKMTIEFDESKESEILQTCKDIITKIEPYTIMDI